MKTNIKRTLVLLSLSLLSLGASAQYATQIVVTEIANEALSEKINKNVSDLLTAFNVAEHEKQAPALAAIDMTDEARTIVTKLWADCPFTCLDNQIVERAVLQPSKEYQIRKIHIVMKPIENVSKDISWKRYQEGVVTINANGTITNFHLALDPELYISVLSSARAVEDLERRMLILEYVERFRNAYNLKDMAFLEQIYSDDALIITGKVVKAVKTDAAVTSLDNEKIEYSRKTKKQYLSDLARVFANNERINVTFDEIKVVRHPARAEFYGVTLKQGWSSFKTGNAKGYSDIGWLFLLWDFSNPDAPQIHVRTWQPTEYQGRPLPEEEIFSLEDFDC